MLEPLAQSSRGSATFLYSGSPRGSPNSRPLKSSFHEVQSSFNSSYRDGVTEQPSSIHGGTVALPPIRSVTLLAGNSSTGEPMSMKASTTTVHSVRSSIAGAATSVRDNNSLNASPMSRRPRKLKITDFELLTTLGTGSFGRVRLAKKVGTDDFYAIKCMKKEKILAKKQSTHIKDERAIMLELSHPFIVKLFASFQDANSVYFVQEFVMGGEMFTHLRAAGRFPIEVAKFYHAELVLAFEYMHSLDIIYRDLKPENLLLDNKGHVKITDFGFAKRVPDRTFTLCGTPEYLAPEVIQSKGHGKAVDWWTMGILLYELIAGYPPFFGDTPIDIYDRVLAGKIKFPNWFSNSAKDLVRGLLEVDPTKRRGCSVHGGAEEVKKSKFFHGANWKKVYACEYSAPLKILVSKPGDTRNFEKYRDSLPNPHARVLTQEEQKIFAVF